MLYSMNLAIKLNYKRLGDYILEVDVRNREAKITQLLGVSIDKNLLNLLLILLGQICQICQISFLWQRKRIFDWEEMCNFLFRR